MSLLLRHVRLLGVTEIKTVVRLVSYMCKLLALTLADGLNLLLSFADGGSQSRSLEFLFRGPGSGPVSLYF